MARTRIYFTLLLLAVFGAREVQGKYDPSYLITCAERIQRGNNFDVNVDILNSSSADFTLILQSRVYNSTTFKHDVINLKTKVIRLEKGSSGVATFKIEEDFVCPSCRLYIRAQGGLLLEAWRGIIVNRDLVAIMVQTDKAIYKPGQMVRYRVLSVYQDLKMYTGVLSIEVLDPRNNKIFVNQNSSSYSGVVEGSLQLSDQPIMGDWCIRVKRVEGSDETRQCFTVENYQLPRFEVTVELAPYILTREPVLTGTVKASYTFGQPVIGMVDLHIGPNRGPDTCGNPAATVRVGFEIDGEGKFQVPRSDIARVTGVGNNKAVKVTAFVTESNTGVTLNGSNTITFYNDLYRIKFLENTPGVFKPGLAYTAFIQVTTPDNLPPSPNVRDLVSVYASATYQVTVQDQKFYQEYKFRGTYPMPGQNLTLPANGIIAVQMNIPKNATQISMKATYRGQTVSKSVNKLNSPSNNFMQLTLLEKTDESAKLMVHATEPVIGATCLVVGKGKLDVLKKLDSEDKSVFNFSITISTQLSPTAKVLVYYVRSNNSEVVADSIAFDVGPVFDNKVSIAFSANKSQPNEEVQVKLTADPESQVNLLAVDQSVLLLKSGNDITPKKVSEAVAKFERGRKPKDSDFALSLSSQNLMSMFSDTGLLVISDIIRIIPVFDGGRRQNSYYRPRPSTRFHDNDLSFDMLPGPVSGVAFSPYGTSDTGLQEVKRIRNVFVESWLWQTAETGSTGMASVQTTVPDTITSWIASAFAVNAKTGLGVAPTTSKLTVFRPFFVTLTYPKLVTQGEYVIIQVTVFNYMASHAKVVVTLKESPNLQNMIQIPGGAVSIQPGPLVKSIGVKSEEQVVVNFPVMAYKIGVADIQVTAQASNAADGVRRQIVIQPVGAPVSFNFPLLLNLDRKQGNGGFKDSILFQMPPSTVKDSDTATVKVTGDLVGPSLSNLESLLSMPMGCGEQSMVRFAPNLYILDYLQLTNRLTPHKRKEIINMLSSGLQRQLTYQRFDGSFSAFGNYDQAGSTWLTALVSRSFIEAEKFIYVDPKIVKKAITWLLDRQGPGGFFYELGTVLDSNIQGSGSRDALTSYVVLTLLKASDVTSELTRELVQNATVKAMDYLEGKLSSMESPFSLALASYALSVAKRPSAKSFADKLMGKAMKKGDLVYWGKKDEPMKSSNRKIWNPPKVQATSIGVMVASYALLGFTTRGKMSEGLPVMKWLTTQQNARGGFVSTQDTTVGIQALTSYAGVVFKAKTGIKLRVKGNANPVIKFEVNRANALDLQTVKFKKVPTTVNFRGSGSGLGLAEVEYKFNVDEEIGTPSFDVNPVILEDSLNSFKIMICTKWLLKRKTGMVVQEIGIPAGFDPDVTTIGNVSGLKRFERIGDTLVLYFDEIGQTSTCYSIIMTRTAKVANSQKSYVKTFDYYQPADQATVFYLPRSLGTSTVCDVCRECCQ